MAAAQYAMMPTAGSSVGADVEGMLMGDPTKRVTFRVGLGYSLGLIAGGAYGLVQGIRQARQFNNSALRVNTILNACTHYGPMCANSMGVISIMFCGWSSILRRVRDRDDPWNTLLASGLAGALYKSMAGPRPALAAGSIGLMAGAVLAGVEAWRERQKIRRMARELGLSKE